MDIDAHGMMIAALLVYEPTNFDLMGPVICVTWVLWQLGMRHERRVRRATLSPSPSVFTADVKLETRIGIGAMGSVEERLVMNSFSARCCEAERFLIFDHRLMESAFKEATDTPNRPSRGFLHIHWLGGH